MTERKDAMTPGQVADMIDGALYFVKWGYSENWFVMLWRNGIMWDDSDCGFRPETLAEIGPMVLMPDQISAQAAELTALRAELDELQQGQTYRYIGKDGKPILARDLEDHRDAALARVGVLEMALTRIAGQHIPDQPAYSAEDELGWAHRQYANQRAIAIAALANKGAYE